MSGVVTRVAGGGQLGRVVLGGLDHGADLSVRPVVRRFGNVVEISDARAQRLARPLHLPFGGFEVLL